MRKKFSNINQVQCVFTDDGITFYGTEQQIFMPYGCLDSVKMSFLGVLQATCGPKICSFTADRKDRAEMKEMVRYATQAMATAPEAEMQVIDLTQKADQSRVSPDLPPEEQLKQYKLLFVQGAISKEEYDAQKRLLKGD